MIPYEFSVLRYSYDPVTQEFINVGVVIYSPSTRFLQAQISTGYGRATRVFGRIDGSRYRFVLRHLQSELDKLAHELSQGLLFDSLGNLDSALGGILPKDDSSLRFDRGGAGVGDDMSKACEKLYMRYVLGSETAQTEGRTREDVWRTFRKPLERLSIANNFVPKQIAALDYVYDFRHAWKNGVWNLYEPVSFDLLDESAIREKAIKWLGRSLSLRESPEEFKLTFLLGAPQDARLRDAFQHAENILNKIPISKALVKEQEAEAFARDVSSQMKHSNSEQVA